MRRNVAGAWFPRVKEQSVRSGGIPQDKVSALGQRHEARCAPDERRTTNDQRRSVLFVVGRWSLVVGRSSLVVRRSSLVVRRALAQPYALTPADLKVPCRRSGLVHLWSVSSIAERGGEGGELRGGGGLQGAVVEERDAAVRVA